MKEEINGQVFDTAVSTLLSTHEEECMDVMRKDDKAVARLYISPEKIYFFHRAYPPEFAVRIGATESIEPATDRCQLAEWVEVSDDAEAEAKAICNADGYVLKELEATHKPDAGDSTEKAPEPRKVDKDAEALTDSSIWGLLELIDQGCLAITSFFDVLSVASLSKEDLDKETIPCVASKGLGEVAEITGIMDELRNRIREARKAA